MSTQMNILEVCHNLADLLVKKVGLNEDQAKYLAQRQLITIISKEQYSKLENLANDPKIYSNLEAKTSELQNFKKKVIQYKTKTESFFHKLLSAKKTIVEEEKTLDYMIKKEGEIRKEYHDAYSLWRSSTAAQSYIRPSAPAPYGFLLLNEEGKKAIKKILKVVSKVPELNNLDYDLFTKLLKEKKLETATTDPAAQILLNAMFEPIDTSYLLEDCMPGACAVSFLDSVATKIFGV